ncbi:hypothetical protein TRFO_38707 [Tritrichomonas foetus]|uniref:Uncharacterized protein n=1 Tax=Tritrichomonas foetus TaxID=1144522 RepID=A0A1J4J8S0_9EUKA|nr:hypothetical protein TRFO_38707 [Tritrichomonas foetus]|eukprot:OHS95089.1 hypothetical protein TRFO_38707 [Tritrichomonas foetus]
MHRKEHCPIPRLDLIDQSRHYSQHVDKLQKSKPMINTTCPGPVQHFAIAHKEKEREWEYADRMSKQLYAKIPKNEKYIKTKKAPKTIRMESAYSDRKLPNRPQFNLRTNLFVNNSPMDSKSSKLSDTASSHFFLTQPRPDSSMRSRSTVTTTTYENNIKRYQFNGQRIQAEDGNSIDEQVSRLNSRFRKTFWVGHGELHNYNNFNESFSPIQPKDTHRKTEVNKTNTIKNVSEYNKSNKSHKMNETIGKTKFGSKKITNRKKQIKPKKTLSYENITKNGKKKTKINIESDSDDENENSEIIFPNSDNGANKNDIYNYNDNKGFEENSGDLVEYDEFEYSCRNKDQMSSIILLQSDVESFEAYEFSISAAQHVLDVPEQILEEGDEEEEQQENIEILEETSSSSSSSSSSTSISAKVLDSQNSEPKLEEEEVHENEIQKGEEVHENEILKEEEEDPEKKVAQTDILTSKEENTSSYSSSSSSSSSSNCYEYNSYNQDESPEAQQKKKEAENIAQLRESLNRFKPPQDTKPIVFSNDSTSLAIRSSFSDNGLKNRSSDFIFNQSISSKGRLRKRKTLNSIQFQGTPKTMIKTQSYRSPLTERRSQKDRGSIGLVQSKSEIYETFMNAPVLYVDEPPTTVELASDELPQILSLHGMANMQHINSLIKKTKIESSTSS